MDPIREEMLIPNQDSSQSVDYIEDPSTLKPGHASGDAEGETLIESQPTDVGLGTTQTSMSNPTNGDEELLGEGDAGNSSGEISVNGSGSFSEEVSHSHSQATEEALSVEAEKPVVDGEKKAEDAGAEEPKKGAQIASTLFERCPFPIGLCTLFIAGPACRLIDKHLDPIIDSATKSIVEYRKVTYGEDGTEKKEADSSSSTTSSSRRNGTTQRRRRKPSPDSIPSRSERLHGMTHAEPVVVEPDTEPPINSEVMELGKLEEARVDGRSAEFLERFVKTNFGSVNKFVSSVKKSHETIYLARNGDRNAMHTVLTNQEMCRQTTIFKPNKRGWEYPLNEDEKIMRRQGEVALGFEHVTSKMYDEEATWLDDERLLKKHHREASSLLAQKEELKRNAYV